VEPPRHARGRVGTQRRQDADPDGRRPLPRARLDHRRRALLPREQSPPARAVARCARRFQHQRDHAIGQHPRHAGGVPVRLRAGRADRTRRSFAGAVAHAGAPDRYPFGRSAGEEAGARRRPRDLRHALHRRGRHEARHGGGAGRARAGRAPAREFRRRLPRSRHRARRRHDDSGRAELSRGAALHGDDRRQRPARLAGHHGAQPGARRAQQDGRARGRSGREPVRQVHADARLEVACAYAVPAGAASTHLVCNSRQRAGGSGTNAPGNGRGSCRAIGSGTMPRATRLR